jgi:hypothetical protein
MIESGAKILWESIAASVVKEKYMVGLVYRICHLAALTSVSNDRITYWRVI